LYSNQTNTCLKRLNVAALKRAEQSIIIHSFALTDSQILKRLLLAKDQGVAITVITDYRNSPQSFTFLAPLLNWSAIKTSGLMHEKVLLIDDTVSFLGSANMTYESMKMHDNLILGFYNKDLNSFLKDYTKKIPLKRSFKNSKAQLFQLGNQTLELWMLPFKGSAPLQRMVDIISQAQKSIDISIFTLTHPKILNALIQAKKRGVHLRVFLDLTSAKGASSKATQLLADQKVPIFISQGLQLLHHKMMLVDKKLFVLGSANWTKSAFEKNHDFFLILSDLSKNQVTQITTVFKKIKKESKELNTDVNYSY
jgi:phosphatidylserine/phosphatidylglycerophosphate/cardiolipin synthase-like enzyme